MRVAKTKALISFTVTAKLICAFVFAYADCCGGSIYCLKIFLLIVRDKMINLLVTLRPVAHKRKSLNVDLRFVAKRSLSLLD